MAHATDHVCTCFKCKAQGHPAHREVYDNAWRNGGMTVAYFIHGERRGEMPGGPSCSEWLVPGLPHGEL